MRIDRFVHGKGCQSCKEGNTGRWAIFWSGSSRNMDVNIPFLKWNEVNRKSGLQQAQRNSGGFLHNFSKLTGNQSSPVSRHAHGFNKEDFSSNRCPGQSGNNASRVGFRYLEMMTLVDAKNVFEVSCINHNRIFIGSLEKFF